MRLRNSAVPRALSLKLQLWRMENWPLSRGPHKEMETPGLSEQIVSGQVVYDFSLWKVSVRTAPLWNERRLSHPHSLAHSLCHLPLLLPFICSLLPSPSMYSGPLICGVLCWEMMVQRCKQSVLCLQGPDSLWGNLVQKQCRVLQRECSKGILQKETCRQGQGE